MGIAAMPSAAMPSAAVAAQTFQVIHNGQQAGVRTVSFPGTISSQVGDGQRTQIQTEYQGPYIFFIAVGFADGRLTHATDDDSAVQDMSYGILNALTGILNQAGNPWALVLAARRHRSTPVPAGPPPRRHTAPF